MSSGGNWPSTTRNATKALRFTETGTVYRRNALRNVDHQFIPFGNGNFPKPLTGVRFCARWQRDGERASEFIQVRPRYNRPRFRTWLTPNRCVKATSTKTRPFANAPRIFQTIVFVSKSMEEFRPRASSFLEICGNFNWKRIGCLVGKGDIVLNL